MSMKWPPKDPDEILDYSIDWSRFLGNNVIASVRWFFYDADDNKIEVVPSQTVDNLTSGPQASTSTVATIVLQGGTLNKEYRITCAVTFGAGLVSERTAVLSIRNN